ncbi:MAG: site-specific integrase [Candidatus Pacearchaeota archaeon]|nr:site-specific integrase [Candidatus Pacearchaeota archaeon]
MAKGVEVRGKTIRVYFRYEGENCKELLPGLAPTEKNKAYASRMVEQIQHEITGGTFDYSRYFPESTRLIDNALGNYLDIWLKIKKQQVAASTFHGYTAIVENHLRPKFGARQADKIDYIDIEGWISSDLEKHSSKTIKEIIAVLRQVFRLYRTRNAKAVDPTEGIKVRLPDDNEPDPFTRDEINKIVNTPPYKKRNQELNLIQFLIWSGARVSEGIALAWEDVIDLDNGIIQLNRAQVRTKYKVTKTKRSKRRIELLKPAREALQAQHKITSKLKATEIEMLDRDNRTYKKDKVKFVFLNSFNGLPINSDYSIRAYFFQKHCDLAGVRYRGPGQCRHTFASQMLTAGMPMEWIAKSMGHSSTEMIRRKYGKWIDEDADDWVKIAEKKLNL